MENECKHMYKKFITNVYGDAIYYWNDNGEICRSLWKCKRCGELIKSPELVPDELAKNEFWKI